MNAMRTVSLILLGALLGGCSAHTRINAGVGGGVAAPPAGTSVSRGAIGVDVRSGSAAGAIIGIAAIGALLGVIANDDVRHVRAVTPDLRSDPVPEMLETRSVNLQDCTRPIADLSANLRCR